MRLFLDDMDARAFLFVKLYGGAENTVVVKTAEEAIAALEVQRFELVSLDHDLGGQVYQSSQEKNCGMEVVRWIVEHLPPIDCIVIHSWNVPASLRMANDLFRSGYNVERVPLGLGKVSYFQKKISER